MRNTMKSLQESAVGLYLIIPLLTFLFAARADTSNEKAALSDVPHGDQHTIKESVLKAGEFLLNSYPVVDTGQTDCFNASTGIGAPNSGDAFAGQDAQYDSGQMSYTMSADEKTVMDNRTGLTWTRSPDLNDDGVVNAADKQTPTGAVAYASMLNTQGFGGFTDWRTPTIKELYSLMNFSGQDISGPNPSAFKPFIDTNFFVFGYGDTNAGDRLIDAQFATTSYYVDRVMNGAAAMFGLNLADGRIKGYPTTGKGYYCYFVRGHTKYGTNHFMDNGDGTISDLATGLMWQQADSGTGMSWQAALAYAEGLSLAGWQDWRLPNAKELQSIVDYSRAPGVTASAAIDPVFSCTAITNEANVKDYPWYWSSTTHATEGQVQGQNAAYVCFGRALGYMNGSWMDVHGAGCQRSDPKSGSLSDWSYAPHGYYSSRAPQGDAIRLFNFVRCVRGGASAPLTDSDEDNIPDWYEYNYTGSTTGMGSTGDEDDDGFPNLSEFGARTSPINDQSYLGIASIAACSGSNLVISWQSALGAHYKIQVSTNLLRDSFASAVAEAIAATPPLNTHTLQTIGASAWFYRLSVEFIP